jgi:hypothetical protein
MLCLVRTKACKRCGGDLSLECDIYGVYVECIQCGASWSKKDMVLPDSSKNRKSTKVEASKSPSDANPRPLARSQRAAPTLREARHRASSPSISKP